MTEAPIYLDYHSTTPCDPAVIEEMIPLFGQQFGNASSRQHVFGLNAAAKVKVAREQLANFINADPEEIIFTSGATESINLAIKGVAELYASKGKHIITASTEHAAVLDCCKRLENKGYEISYIQPDSKGFINPAKVESAIRKDTILIAIMWANNETGYINKIEAYAKLAVEHGIVFFSDATQALGKMPVNAEGSGAGMLSFSAHKIYGPKGVGALYIRRKNPRIKLSAQMDGGGQERGIRSGTLNVPGIAGFGKAVQLYENLQDNENSRINLLRDEFEKAMLDLENVFVNGDPDHRLPTVSNICFRFTDGKLLMNELNKKLAVSSGSACSSASPEPSHVLLALGLGKRAAEASVRFSLGRFTSKEEILKAIEFVKSAVKEVRANQYPDYVSWVKQAVEDEEWSHPAMSVKL